MTRKMMIIGAVVVVCLSAGGWYAKTLTGKAAAKNPGFDEIKIMRGDIELTVETTGTVQPDNRLVVKPPIAGRIEQVLVEEGQHVKRGQILAQMSSTDRAALIDMALAKGPEEVKHWAEVYKATPLVAPMDGTVIARQVEPGVAVQTVDSAFVLSDRLIIVAQVDETDMARISLGQEARMTMDAFPDKDFRGRVNQIAYEARTVNNVTVYDVRVVPDKVPDVMRSGMTVNARFSLGERKGVPLIPVAAVKREGTKVSVLVPTPSEKGPPTLTPRPIQLGLDNGKFAEVVSGLNDGDVVAQMKIQADKPDAANGTNPFMPSRPGAKKDRGPR